MSADEEKQVLDVQVKTQSAQKSSTSNQSTRPNFKSITPSSSSREFTSDQSLLMLDGSNFAWWKPRALQALNRRRLGYTIDGEIECNIDLWHADLDERQATSLLLAMMPPEYFDSLQEFKSPKSIWVALEERFSVDRIDKKYIADQFYFLRYDNKLTIGQYIAKINNHAQQLKDIKHTVDELAYLHVLTKGLPSAFNNIVETIDNTKDISYADACAMLLKKELSLKKGESEKNQYSAALVFRGRARGRGRSRGRGQFRGRGRGRGGPLPETFICRNCGGRGHYQSQCPTPYKPTTTNNQNPQAQTNSQNDPKKKIQFNDYRGGYNSGSYRGRNRYIPSYSAANVEHDPQQQDYYASMAEFIDDDEVLTDFPENEFAFRISTEQQDIETNNTQWIMDTGASAHIVCYPAQFHHYISIRGSVILPNKQQIRAYGLGDIHFVTYIGDNVPSQVTLANVLFCPDFSINLISLSAISEAGYQFHGFGDTCNIMTKEGHVIISGQKFPTRNLYFANLYPLQPDVNMKATVFCTMTETDYNNTKDLIITNEDYKDLSENDKWLYKWHNRLAHLAFPQMNRMKFQIPSQINRCRTCALTKHCRKVFPKKLKITTQKPLQLVHSDICGPLQEDRDNKRYFGSFIDDYSRFSVVVILRYRSQIVDEFKHYIDRNERHTGFKVKALRCDNAKEYVEGRMKEFCDDRGISIQSSTVYTPQQNGVSERYNRIINDKVRAMLTWSKLPNSFWSLAVHAANYVKNRSIAKPRHKIPYEVWYRTKVNINHLRTWGCLVMVLIPEQQRHSKHDPVSKPAIFVGYTESNHIYYVLDWESHVVQRATDIKFWEDTPAGDYFGLTISPILFNIPLPTIPLILPTSAKDAVGDGIMQSVINQFPEDFIIDENFEYDEQSSSSCLNNLQSHPPTDHILNHRKIEPTVRSQQTSPQHQLNNPPQPQKSPFDNEYNPVMRRQGRSNVGLLQTFQQQEIVVDRSDEEQDFLQESAKRKRNSVFQSPIELEPGNGENESLEMLPEFPQQQQQQQSSVSPISQSTPKKNNILIRKVPISSPVVSSPLVSPQPAQSPQSESPSPLQDINQLLEQQRLILLQQQNLALERQQQQKQQELQLQQQQLKRDLVRDPTVRGSSKRRKLSHPPPISTSTNDEVSLRRSSRNKTAEPKVVVTRSGRVSKPTVKYSMSALVNMDEEDMNISYNFPDLIGEAYCSLKQALEGPEREHWKEAMQKEHDALINHHTWDLQDPPRDVPIIPTHWVLTKKKNENGETIRFKARLVAQGNRQIEGQDFDVTYAPVVSPTVVRILLSVAAYLSYDVYHIDIDNAFLNGPIDQDVYLYQAPYFKDQHRVGAVCKLNKAIYGLKQAARCWWKHIDSTLLNIGFSKVGDIKGVYVRKDVNQVDKTDIKTFIILYVDDILIICYDQFYYQRVIDALTAVYKFKELGKVKNFLNIKVDYFSSSTRTTKPTSICLSQEAYIDSLLKKFRMTDARITSTPTSARTRIGLRNINPEVPFIEQKDNDQKFVTLYKSLIGGLLYLAMMTRPDITWAVTVLARFSQNPQQHHMHHAREVLRYLKSTKSSKLQLYPRSYKVDIYTDADHAGDPDDAKSTTGILILFGGAPISWFSKKQNQVSNSTAIAEYQALARAVEEADYIKKVLTALDYNCGVPRILCDNTAALAIAEENKDTPRTKSVNIKFHIVQEAKQQGRVTIEHVPTIQNLADGFTKPLDSVKLQFLMKKIMKQ